jgi:hypothetical protein
VERVFNNAYRFHFGIGKILVAYSFIHYCWWQQKYHLKQLSKIVVLHQGLFISVVAFWLVGGDKSDSFS